MSIQIKTTLIVGYRFSSLCYISKKNQEAIFLTDKLKEKISKHFEDETIDIKEITPEFLAFFFGLDFIEFSNKKDSIIGKKIEETNIGVKEEEVRNFHEIETSMAEVKAKINAIDESINQKTDMKV